MCIGGYMGLRSICATGMADEVPEREKEVGSYTPCPLLELGLVEAFGVHQLDLLEKCGLSHAARPYQEQPRGALPARGGRACAHGVAILLARNSWVATPCLEQGRYRPRPSEPPRRGWMIAITPHSGNESMPLC